MTHDIPFATLAAAAAALRRRSISSSELTELFLERIERLNPRLAAFTDVIAASARREAARADRLRKAGRAPSGIAGLPIAVKDIIDTTPAVCSAGLPFLGDYRPATDAAVVRRLRRAGAVILGVTATDPGAFGVRTASVSHPQAPSRTVGGSSGGSGAALAAGLCLGALGTDTGGSIRIPAACCAIAGLKPTRGRVPLDGVRPLVWSLDHVGPMARRAADLALMQVVLDPRFAHRKRTLRRPVTIGTDPAYYRDADRTVRSAVEGVLDACRSLGCEIREVALPGPDDALSLHGVIFPAESEAYHRAAFPGERDRYPPVARHLLDLHKAHTGADYVSAMRRRNEITKQVEALFEEVDWVVLPTLPVPPPDRSADGIVIAGRTVEFTLALVRYTCLFNHTGHPVVALPAAATARPGVAGSVQVIGPLGQDADLLAFTGRLERALDI